MRAREQSDETTTCCQSFSTPLVEELAQQHEQVDANEYSQGGVEPEAEAEVAHRQRQSLPDGNANYGEVEQMTEHARVGRGVIESLALDVANGLAQFEECLHSRVVQRVEHERPPEPKPRRSGHARSGRRRGRR
jgi:hypothetical protein